MKVFKAPEELPDDLGSMPSVFLAGSIEMGTAENWQTRIEDELQDLDGYLLNPRRDDWDSSWEQVIENEQFHEQVSWELHGMDGAEIVFFYFSPGTKSPITLMELGLCAATSGVIVCCPHGFWRKGNVDIVCDEFNLALTEDLDEAIEWLRLAIDNGV